MRQSSCVYVPYLRKITKYVVKYVKIKLNNDLSLNLVKQTTGKY